MQIKKKILFEGMPGKKTNRVSPPKKIEPSRSKKKKRFNSFWLKFVNQRGSEFLTLDLEKKLKKKKKKIKKIK